MIIENLEKQAGPRASRDIDHDRVRVRVFQQQNIPAIIFGYSFQNLALAVGLK